MIGKRWFLVCFMLGIFGIETMAAIGSDKEPVVALVENGKFDFNLSDLVVANGAKLGVSFVERREVAKILAEKKLSESGLVSAATSIRIGHMLKADMIGVFDKEVGHIRLSVMNVKTGVCLQDKVFPGNSVDASVSKATAAIEAAVDKYRKLISSQATFLAFLPLNYIFLDSHEITKARKIQQQVQRLLLAQDKVVILEREFLDWLWMEKMVSNIDLVAMLSCSYTVELEAKTVDGQIAMSGVLRNSKTKLNRTIKVSTAGDQSEQIASKLAAAILREIKPVSSSKDRMVEAQIFLNDAKLAFNNNDFDKCVISLKNAFILDQGLKFQINGIIKKIFANHAEKIKRKHTLVMPNDLALVTSFRRLISLLYFYRHINNVYYQLNPSLPAFMDFPEVLQNDFREYYHVYFSTCWQMLQQERKTVTPDLAGAIHNQERYLEKLAALMPYGWTCEYWNRYMAPELKKYFIMAADFYRQHSEVDFQVNPGEYCLEGHFFDSSGRLDQLAFNTNLELLQLMLRSDIIAWQVVAVEKLHRIRDEINTAAMLLPINPKDDGMNKVYHRQLSTQCNPVLLLGPMDNEEVQYGFMKYLLQRSIGLPPKAKLAVGKYLAGNTYRHIIRNNQVNGELFVLLLQAGFPAGNELRSLCIEKKHDLVSDLHLLKKMTAPLNNSTFNQALEHEITALTTKNPIVPSPNGNQVSTIIGNFPIRKTFNERGVEIKDTYRVFQAIFEGDFLYLPVYCDENAFLLKFNLADRKSMVGKEGVFPWLVDNQAAYYDSMTVCGNQLIEVSRRGGINFFPINGDRPSGIEKRDLIDSSIIKACTYKGKVYYAVKALENVKLEGVRNPMRIVELDTATRRGNIIFASNQIDNNPLRTDKLKMFCRGGYYQGGMLFPLGKTLGGFWRFGLDNRKWAQIMKFNVEFDGTAWADDSFFYLNKNDSMMLFDLNIEGRSIHRVVSEWGGFKPVKKNNCWFFNFCLRANKRNINFSGSTLSGSVIWNHYMMIFPHFRKMIKMNDQSMILLVFSYHGKQYCVYRHYEQNATLKILLSEISPDLTSEPVGTSVEPIEIIAL